LARPRAVTGMRCLVCLVLAAAAAQPVRAQNFVQPEARLDVVGPGHYVLQPGVGLTAGLGYYARLTAIAGYAPAVETRMLGDHWRADVITRVVLDPFREARWGLSFGGGLSVRRQTYLAAVVDLEGPATAGWLPAVEIGVSGGWRAGVVLRRAVRQRR